MTSAPSESRTDGNATPEMHAPPREPACTQAGDRLALQICRDGDTLAWTVTNHTTLDLWAFVAPSGTKRATFDRANVNVRSDGGNVVLSKLPLPPLGGERTFVAAVSLAPGESDQGSIPIGARIDPSAANITGAKILGTREVWTVTLEIAFAEKRGGDRATTTQPAPLVVVYSTRAQQEVVTAPPVSWR